MKHLLLTALACLLVTGADLRAQGKGTTPPAGVPPAKTTGGDSLYTQTNADDEDRTPIASPGFVFRDEIRVPVLYQTNGEVSGGFGGGAEFHRYFSGRAHDDAHGSLFSETVGQPSSSVDLAFAYAPNPTLEFKNHGYMVSVGAVTMTSREVAIGGMGRYGRTTLASSELQIVDYELGPRFSFWPSDRMYIDDQLLYRHIGGYSDAALKVRVSDEEYFNLRHHLAYVVSEDRTVTYAHDLEARVGIHQNFHVNNFTMLNYFLFATSSSFSFGPAAGFSLDYTLGSRTSVLTLPIFGRAEYFFGTGRGVVMVQAGYDLPTMPGQRNGQAQALGSIGYRF